MAEHLQARNNHDYFQLEKVSLSFLFVQPSASVLNRMELPTIFFFISKIQLFGEIHLQKPRIFLMFLENIIRVDRQHINFKKPSPFFDSFKM